MTTTVRITWDAASARRAERQFLARPAGSGTPVAEVVGAMASVRPHAQVLSAAEVSAGADGRADAGGRTDGTLGRPVPDQDVRSARHGTSAPGA
ncbi:hypothetical protein [Streptomyces violaceus]|uniref:Uncharacterized protein n=1 Tax=Streptomyces violaceus TaxID=1936 RepID=A0ABZ1P6E7_STRVL